MLFAAVGGQNHRLDLSDGVLIKNNHIALAGGVAVALQKALRNRREEQPIEIEVRTLAELDEALANGAESILLDNMKVEDVRQAVQRVASHSRRVPIEASGGIRLENVRELRRNRRRLHFCWSAHPFAASRGPEYADCPRIGDEKRAGLRFFSASKGLGRNLKKSRKQALSGPGRQSRFSKDSTRYNRRESSRPRFGIISRLSSSKTMALDKGDLSLYA